MVRKHETKKTAIFKISHFGEKAKELGSMELTNNSADSESEYRDDFVDVECIKEAEV